MAGVVNKSVGETVDVQNDSTARALARIGMRIRDHRKRGDMTLQQLAEISGISASMLSLVERGLASPSIGSLIVVSEALGCSMSELMASDDHSDDIVVRLEDVERVTTSQNVVRQVLKEDPSNGISIAINEYAPGTSSNDTPISHGGFEYGMLLEGTLTVMVDNEVHVIRVGDLISYSSKRPHRIWNHGDHTARTIWINTNRR
jgi:transcriptional regulator with XRE-family HTH domain